MKDATHFIEIWKDEYGNYIQDDVYKISKMDRLETTEKIGGYTIAVFKIKFKNK